jgi:hypothetical protein
MTVGKVAANLRAFQIAVNAHDRENPEPHPAAYGIGMAAFDMERLGFVEGEDVLPGITLTCDGKTTGNFRVLCGAEHADPSPTTDAVARYTVPTGAGS